MFDGTPAICRSPSSVGSRRLLEEDLGCGLHGIERLMRLQALRAHGLAAEIPEWELEEMMRDLTG
jgi:hypothetical protein